MRCWCMQIEAALRQHEEQHEPIATERKNVTPAAADQPPEGRPIPTVTEVMLDDVEDPLDASEDEYWSDLDDFDDDMSHSQVPL
jgi:hypothetical protein